MNQTVRISILFNREMRAGVPQEVNPPIYAEIA